MNDTEKFLRVATRGLWGKARRNAVLELRGAVEDKIYRYTLLGMTIPEAERAALRDLGSPAAISRELSAVHSMPQGAKVALFIVLASALGLQAAAQIPAVRAMPTPRAEQTYLETLCDYSPAAIAKAPPQMAQYKRQEVERLGSAAKAKADCLAMQPNPNRYLRLSDLVAALREGGMGVLSADNGLVTVKLPNGESRSADFSQDSRMIGGEFYALKHVTLEKVLSLVDGPARLSGTVNPVLTIGSVKVQLGTKETPLATGDLLAPLLQRQLLAELEKAVPSQVTNTAQQVRLAWFESGNGTSHPDMLVAAPENTMYATVSNGDFLAPDKNCCGITERFYTLGVAPVRQGKLPQPIGVGQDGKVLSPRIVRTPQELVQASTKRQHAALLYRLDTSDLRNIRYLPVSRTK